MSVRRGRREDRHIPGRAVNICDRRKKANGVHVDHDSRSRVRPLIGSISTSTDPAILCASAKSAEEAVSGLCFLPSGQLVPKPRTRSTAERRSNGRKGDRPMIDGAKRKRRNGTKGEQGRLWYARWPATRFAQRFALGQIAEMASRAPAFRLVGQ